MSKTNRALAIVAVVATLVSAVLQLWSTQVSAYGLSSILLVEIWVPTTTLAAPVVSTFAVVVAAQARRWGWLVAFALLGLIGVYGPGILFILEPYLGLARPLRLAGLDPLRSELLPLALPAIAALIFVVSAAPRPRLSGVEEPATQTETL